MKETQISIFQMVFKLKISAYLTTKLMHAYQNNIYIVIHQMVLYKFRHLKFIPLNFGGSLNLWNKYVPRF